MKKPFITKEQAEEIIKTYPTPFHIYDEKAIRQNARDLFKAFSWNKGFREYFAVKATPNPFILKVLQEEGCGVDCSSLTELMMSECCGFSGSDIMFSSNVTPKEDYLKAREMGAFINLDDFTHIKFLDDLCGIPETIFCRYNPGGHFEIETQIMDNPGDAKYGFTHEQIIEGFKILKEKGAKNFGIHAFLASNTVSNAYYPKLARILFELAVEIKEKTGAQIKYINLSGGVALLYSAKVLDSLKPENQDQKVGIDIIRKATQAPIRQIAENAGVDGAVVAGKLLESTDTNFGYNAQSGEYTDMVKAGIIDPTKVVRTALQDAASVGGLLITTEAMVTEAPQKECSCGGAGAGAGAGMPGMGF